MQLNLSNPPTYRDLADIFDLMRELNPADLQRCADDIISYASNEAIKEMYHFRQDPPPNYYERDPGIVTYLTT